MRLSALERAILGSLVSHPELLAEIEAASVNAASQALAQCLSDLRKLRMFLPIVDATPSAVSYPDWLRQIEIPSRPLEEERRVLLDNLAGYYTELSLECKVIAEEYATRCRSPKDLVAELRRARPSPNRRTGAGA